jgi:hypothetical protein
MMRGSIVAVLIAAGFAATSAMPSVTPPCAGHDLTSVFAAIPGSAGAGHIEYSLRLNNISSHGCVVKGLPRLHLLDVHGRLLPTAVRVADPVELPGVQDVISAHWWGNYGNARFSPDVPGVGEQHIGPCEPVAHRLRIKLPSGGSLTAPIKPPTSVCEHGSISLTVKIWLHA